MLITYTNTDGNVVVYTANTAITSNVLLGTVSPGFAAQHPEMAEEALNTATAKVPAVEVYDGVEVNVTKCYFETTTHVLDYGLSSWAHERLSSTDLEHFQAQCAVWTTSVNPSEDLNLLYWWKKYIADPNVTVTEE